MLDRTQAPQYRITENITLPAITHLGLTNDVPFNLIRGGIDDAIVLVVSFKGGAWIQNKRLVSRTTTKTLTEGTKNKTAAEISDIFNYHAVDAKFSSGNHYNLVKLTLLRKHLLPVLELLNEVLTNPVFPEKEIIQYLHNEKQNYIIDLEEVELVARNYFYKAVFGYEHPYGTYAVPDDFDKISVDDLIGFHNKVFGYNNLSLWAAGYFADADISLIDRYLTHIRPGAKIRFEHKEIKPDVRKYIHIEKENSLQSAIYIGNTTIDVHHPDFLALQFVITALGGYFSSRLMTNLREDKGLTYGIYSYIDSDLMGSVIVIEAEVHKENTEVVLEEIRGEIDKIKADGLSEDELITVKNYIMANLLKLTDGPYALANYLNRLNTMGLDEKIIFKHIETIKAIDNEQVIEIANKYLDFDSFYKVIVG